MGGNVVYWYYTMADKIAEKNLHPNTKIKPASDNSLMNSLTVSGSSIFTQKLLIILVVVIIAGGISGYILAKKGGGGSATSGESLTSSSIKKGTTVGSDDTKTFKDTVEGTLKGGGIEGEGQFHLVRPGGDSQNVYLTSSIVDLSKFVGKKIKVWGETQAAEHAGWLMDVGRLEVL